MAELKQADLVLAPTGVDFQPLSSPTDAQEGQGPQPAGVNPADSKGTNGEDLSDNKETAVSMSSNDCSEDESQWNPGRCAALLAWFGTNASLIYASQALSAWGDRMWTFAVALYLVEIENNSLRLTAVFGFSLTISVLLFGTLVGHWVDKTSRLKAARLTLFIQNCSVMLNAVCLLMLYHYKADIVPIGGGVLYLACQAVVIILGVFANLASVAEKICVQKDWVVILAGGDNERLAVMNATVRRIDLTVNILAPILVGQIMAFGSLTIAGIFIAAWNLVSLVVEYNLLLHVYKRVPRLAIKMGREVTEDASEPAGETETGEKTEGRPEELLQEDDYKKASTLVDENAAEVEDTALLLYSGQTGTDEQAVADPDRICSAPSQSEEQPPPPSSTHQWVQRGLMPLRQLAGWARSTYEGWLIYKSYPVYLAGMALACLYMTVMGFDSITNGYGYTMGLSESLLGVIAGSASVTGIIGTFGFTRMRQKVGVTRTGLYSLAEEILCLTLCVCSIWAAGSPFDPYYYLSGQSSMPTTNATLDINSTTEPSIPTSPILQPSSSGEGLSDFMTTPSSRQKRFGKMFQRSVVDNNPADVNTAAPNFTTEDTSLITPGVSNQPAKTTSYASPILFFTGIVISRIGLWMFDLVTTQLIQEHVREDQRGVFNGVQRSLECSMDMLHFILVIALPAPETFGFLIILSFIFICIGLVFYSVYAFRVRGHLFHPEKLTSCIQNGCPNGMSVQRLIETDVEA